MQNDWLNHKHRVQLSKETQYPCIIVAFFEGLPNHIHGILTRFSGPSGAPFLMIIPNTHSANASACGRLLGLALLEAESNLLQPTLMPSRMATAFLRADGTFRHQLIRTFAPSIVEEIKRLETILLQNHQEFLVSLLQAVKGSSLKGLQPPPADCPLKFEPGSAFLFEPPPIQVDTSALNRTYGKIERHKQVRLDYERDRYMAHLTDAQLISRGNDIFRNFHQIDAKGRITFEHSDPRPFYWLDRFTEFLQECYLRDLHYETVGRGVSKDFPFPKESSFPAQIARCVEETSLPIEPYLVRYGLADHILEAYEEGRIRFGPASSYTDASLNLARQDDELSLDIDIDPTVVPVIRLGAIQAGRRIQLKGNIETNFYVHCLSTRLRSRLFLDFDANACLIIRKPQEFRDRFFQATRRALPGFQTESGRVEYYDPLCVSPAELVPIFWKHFRYAYQEEVRFIAVPREPIKELEPIFITLGSLKDVADIRKVHSPEASAS
jgi:hypothetical protein